MLFPFNAKETDRHKIAFHICETAESVTYADLDKRANQVAHLIRSLNIKTGEHVAILMGNGRCFLETCFGMDRSGVYYTTISTRLNIDEVVYIIRDCGAKLLIISADLADRFPTLQSHLPEGILCFCAEGKISLYPAWETALSNCATTPIPDPAQGGDMLYSSGSTGRPKGVKRILPITEAGQRTMVVDLLTPLFDYSENTRYLSPAPLYHAAPLRHTMTVIKLGGCAYIMQQFDAQTALQHIAQHHITHIQCVPTMFVRFLKLPEEIRNQFEYSSLKVVLHAAAPCPIQVKQQMIAWWGPIIHEYYAGTENNGFCSITPAEWLAHPGSVGRASQGELHICNDEGLEIPVGEIGLVYFANGPSFVYHNDTEKTRQTKNALGWTTLGDIGRVDKEGYLYLVDRKAFMIISGGVNIYPQEIENILISHPLVLDVAVIGVPDEDLGEAVKAVVQPIQWGNATPTLAKELIEYCRTRLAHYKCPRSIDFQPELPRHPTGKIYKKLIRDQYWNKT